MIDGSNDSVSECERRSQEVEEKGIQYITMAITGSDVDARKGPAFLPSGPRDAYEAIKPILNKVAAEVDHHACVGYLGTGASAAFVHMICGSLEIGESELLAECYDLMRQMRLSNTEMGDLFADWNKGAQASFLLEITATIVRKKDADVDGCKPSDHFLVERIVDQAPLKKSGVETLGESAAAQASSSVLDSAVFARYMTCSREQRAKGSAVACV